jgi:hypothetical protein
MFIRCAAFSFSLQTASKEDLKITYFDLKTVYLWKIPHLSGWGSMAKQQIK